MNSPFSPTALLLTIAISAPTCFAQVPYGAATNASNGTTPILSSGDPYMGNTGFSYHVSGVSSGSIGALGISTGRDSIALGQTELLISFDPSKLLGTLGFTVAGTPGAAQIPLPLSMPVSPSLAGLLLYSQAVILDPTTPWLTASQGTRLEISLPARIFIGTSVGGSSDPTWIVDPISKSVVRKLTSGTNNVTDAEFNAGGRLVYVGTSLGSKIAVLDTASPTMSYSTFWNAGGVAYGIGIDKENQIVYTVGTGSTGGRELIAIDARVGNPGYGTVLKSTVGLGSLFVLERWELSPSGRIAAAIDIFGKQLYIIDTDPRSSGYMSYRSVGSIPVGPGAFPLPNNCVITPRDEQVLVVVQQAGRSPGEIARCDLASGKWIDHDPSTPVIDNIGPWSSPSAAVPSGLTGLDLSRNGRVLAVAGINGGVGRLDLDPSNPATWSFRSFASSLSSANTWACAVSNDTSMIAYTSWIGGPGQAGPATLHIIDSLTGSQVANIPLGSAANIYTCRWH